MSEHAAAVIADLQRAILSPTRSAACVPHDVSYACALSKQAQAANAACGVRILRLLNQLLALTNGTERSALDESELVDNFRRAVVEPVDSLLERTDGALDRHYGRKPVTAAPADQQRRSTQSQATWRGAKPQLLFHQRPNNEPGVPWVPPLRSKFNALEALDLAPRATTIELDDGTTAEIMAVAHPYRAEIEAYSRREPAPATLPVSLDVNEAPLTLIESVVSFRAMVSRLRQASELAVDVEHHDYRSYSGITCLLQLSTRDHDYIVDVLIPEVRTVAHELNEIFTDPGITKVLHGAERDVIWLQRDLGVYIVGLFDTYHASAILRFAEEFTELPQKSLAYLLERFASFKANKQLQLADWRTRPLPTDMVDYARSDTHFLLHIYDCLRRDLSTIASNNSEDPLNQVLRRSAETASRTYYGPGLPEHDHRWRRLFERWRKEEWLGTPRENAVQDLYRWRDRTARELDESVHYVLSNAALLSLAQQLPSVVDRAAPLLRGSPVARERAAEICEIIDASLHTDLRRPYSPPTVPMQLGDSAQPLAFGSRHQTSLWEVWEAARPHAMAISASAFLGRTAGAPDRRERLKMLADTISLRHRILLSAPPAPDPERGIVATAGSASPGTSSDDVVVVEGPLRPAQKRREAAGMLPGSGSHTMSTRQHSTQIGPSLLDAPVDSGEPLRKRSKVSKAAGGKARAQGGGGASLSMSRTF